MLSQLDYPGLSSTVQFVQEMLEQQASAGSFLVKGTENGWLPLDSDFVTVEMDNDSVPLKNNHSYALPKTKAHSVARYPLQNAIIKVEPYSEPALIKQEYKLDVVVKQEVAEDPDEPEEQAETPVNISYTPEETQFCLEFCGAEKAADWHQQLSLHFIANFPGKPPPSSEAVQMLSEKLKSHKGLRRNLNKEEIHKKKLKLRAAGAGSSECKPSVLEDNGSGCETYKKTRRGFGGIHLKGKAAGEPWH